MLEHRGRFCFISYPLYPCPLAQSSSLDNFPASIASMSGGSCSPVTSFTNVRFNDFMQIHCAAPAESAYEIRPQVELSFSVTVSYIVRWVPTDNSPTLFETINFVLGSL